MYFYGLNLGSPGARQSGTQRPLFEQAVCDFYFQESQEPKDDLSCCSHDYNGKNSEVSDIMSDSEPTYPSETDPVSGPSSGKTTCVHGLVMNLSHLKLGKLLC